MIAWGGRVITDSQVQHSSSSVNERLRGLLISIIVPVFNSEHSLPVLIHRLIEVMEAARLSYELIFVNDGSCDGSWETLCRECSQSSGLKCINLIRNFGQHNAILCGLNYSRGDYIVTLDDDLQNPPEEIISLLNRAVEGYELVCGRFEKKRHALWRRFGSWLINCVNESIFYKPRDFTHTNFRVMSRALVDRIRAFRTPFPYISGLAIMLSGSRSNVLVKHHERLEGKSAYSLFRLLTLVSTILFNYSALPLRIACCLGFVVAALSFTIGGYYFLKSMLIGSSVQGWTSLVCLVSFFSGTLLLVFAMVGEYLRRLLNCASGIEPYYVEAVRTSEGNSSEYE